MARWCRDHDACKSCGGTRVKHAARGLCRTCHSRHNNAGTLGQFDAKPKGTRRDGTPMPDFLYAKWLGSKQARRSGMGADGWSEFGRWCGDMSPIDEGCGTWFHEHVANGLCGECCLRYSGVFKGEPRDVRVSREVMS